MITLKGVDFHYGGENGTGDGVDGIDLTIADGECVVLCGRSGCGKTTLTRLINGLIPHFYEGELIGEVLIDDHNVSKSELSETSKLVGSVFQNPKSQFFNIDTSGELVFGCENIGLPRDEIGKRLDRTVKDLKLAPLLNRNIFELSGGEKQQIACGSVYAADPQIYVLDEPSSNLDKKAINRIHDIFAKMKANGNTLVISEHRIHYLMDIVDRFIYLDDGIITGEYTADDMRAMPDETLAELGLRCTDIRNIPANDQSDTMQNAAAALDVIDLSCSRGNSRILDIDRILLPENSIVAVVGDNGCGKSTLAEALCGLIPSDGSVALSGTFLSNKQRQQQCYMVMQDVNRQLFSDSVMEEVMLNAAVSQEDAEKTLEELGLGDFKDRHPASLSGGQKQRTAIAAALCAGKDIILYDEPTSGLDRTGMQRFGELLNSTRSKVKLSFIITHDPELILNCCTHVLHMDRGRVTAFYPMNEEGAQRVRNYYLSKSSDTTSKVRDKKSQIGKILEHTGKERPKVFLSALLMMIGAAASIVPYGLVGSLVRKILSGGRVTLDTALPVIVGMLICEILYAVFYMLGLRVSHHAAFAALENIRCKLQEKLEQQPLGSVMARSKGELKKLFSDDIESIEILLAHMIPEGTANLFVPAIAMLFLIYTDWQLALLTLLMIAIGLSVSKRMYSAGMDRMGSYFAASKRMNSAIVEYVNGMEVVRVFNRDGAASEKYEKAITDYRDLALNWYRVCWPWMALYGSVFSSVVLYSLPFGILLILLGQLEITNYILALILSFGIGPLLLHCMSFVGSIPQVSFKTQSLEKALDDIPVKTGESDITGDQSITFENVHFSYRDNEVIKGVSFRAEQGKTTALVGHSGSGKSTLARLAVHYYDVSEGHIRIGATDICDTSLDKLNEHIAYVSQEVFLFNKSIMENIRVGRQDAADDEVIEAAKKAECHDFIMSLPNGYDTPAGLAGGMLSGGQKQRIAFARAFLKNAPIIILDEATAFVDAENEQKMRRAMEQLTVGKTVIVIAHKLSSIKNADRIILLDNGRIAASGTHDELTADSAQYRQLWAISQETQNWRLKEAEV
ncbi:MAG TPA: energy-coupling factor transporter ATPase [Ruminococcus sp.]|nr:energy-coupling factor transporter ATPase [Ruminococcus sp.]